MRKEAKQLARSNLNQPTHHASNLHMVRTQDDRSTTNTSRNSYLDNAFLDIPNNLNNCLTKTLLSSVSREGGGGG